MPSNEEIDEALEAAYGPLKHPMRETLDELIWAGKARCLAAALREERKRVEKGDGSTEHPFFDQFIGKMFERQDNKLSFGVCERDDGYELTVIPVRVGPVRYYRINPDGTIDDLAALAEVAKHRDGIGEDARH